MPTYISGYYLRPRPVEPIIMEPEPMLEPVPEPDPMLMADPESVPMVDPINAEPPPVPLVEDPEPEAMSVGDSFLRAELDRMEEPIATPIYRKYYNRNVDRRKRRRSSGRRQKKSLRHLF